VREVEDVANLTGSIRHEGLAMFYRGAVAAAMGEAVATDELREAARKLSGSGMVLLSCRARLALARVLADTDKPLAIVEARAALSAFERLGATQDADVAAAFLRGLGVKGRTGPKDVGVLSKREVEVLRLVAQGMTNAEIADRLFISVKTTGHHVSNILLKLGLRSRTEAAAFAAVHLGPEPTPK
jgi:DNA-binding NarL/FixJ family response regulator